MGYVYLPLGSAVQLQQCVKSVLLIPDADEHRVAGGPSAKRLVGAVGETITLHRHGKPVGAGQVRIEFREHAPIVRSRRFHHDVGANRQAEDSHRWRRRRRSHGIDRAAEQMDRAAVHIVARGHRHGKSNRPL